MVVLCYYCWSKCICGISEALCIGIFNVGRKFSSIGFLGVVCFNLNPPMAFITSPLVATGIPATDTNIESRSCVFRFGMWQDGVLV